MRRLEPADGGGEVKEAAGGGGRGGGVGRCASKDDEGWKALDGTNKFHLTGEQPEIPSFPPTDDQ